MRTAIRLSAAAAIVTIALMLLFQPGVSTTAVHLWLLIIPVPSVIASLVSLRGLRSGSTRAAGWAAVIYWGEVVLFNFIGGALFIVGAVLQTLAWRRARRAATAVTPL